MCWRTRTSSLTSSGAEGSKHPVAVVSCRTDALVWSVFILCVNKCIAYAFYLQFMLQSCCRSSSLKQMRTEHRLCISNWGLRDVALCTLQVRLKTLSARLSFIGEGRVESCLLLITQRQSKECPLIFCVCRHLNRSQLHECRLIFVVSQNGFCSYSKIFSVHYVLHMFSYFWLNHIGDQLTIQSIGSFN